MEPSSVAYRNQEVVSQLMPIEELMDVVGPRQCGSTPRGKK